MQLTMKWYIANIPVWTKHLGHLAGTVAHGLEIGSFEGGAATWFATNILTAPGATLRCVDPWENIPDTEARFDANTAELRQTNKIIKHKSRSAPWLANRLAEGNREEFDYIYIDGDHRACAVLADAVLAWPLLKLDGIFIFDDYRYVRRRIVPPRPAIDGFLASHDNWKLLHKGEQVIVKKSAKGYPF